MSGSGWETILEVRERSGVHLGCPGVIGWPSLMFEGGREPLPDVREALSDVRERSGGPLGCSGVVGRSIRIPRSSREALPGVQKFSGVPPRCPGVVERPFQLTGSGGRPSRMSRSGR